VTKLNRNEPTLHTAFSGDVIDTTSPSAMLGDMKSILVGDALQAASGAVLIGRMAANTTGWARRLRAGVPADWQVGD